MRARRLHLEEPRRVRASTADVPRSRPGSARLLGDILFFFKKKNKNTKEVPQARQPSTDSGLLFFSITDKNIAQGRRSDWQEERNGS